MQFFRKCVHQEKAKCTLTSKLKAKSLHKSSNFCKTYHADRVNRVGLIYSESFVTFVCVFEFNAKENCGSVCLLSNAHTCFCRHGYKYNHECIIQANRKINAFLILYLSRDHLRTLAKFRCILSAAFRPFGASPADVERMSWNKFTNRLVAAALRKDFVILLQACIAS